MAGSSLLVAVADLVHAIRSYTLPTGWTYEFGSAPRSIAQLNSLQSGFLRAAAVHHSNRAVAGSSIDEKHDAVVVSTSGSDTAGALSSIAADYPGITLTAGSSARTYVKRIADPGGAVIAASTAKNRENDKGSWPVTIANVLHVVGGSVAK